MYAAAAASGGRGQHVTTPKAAAGSKWSKDSARFAYIERAQKPRAPSPGAYTLPDTTLYQSSHGYPHTADDFISGRRNAQGTRFQEPTGPRGKALHAKPPSNDAFTPPPGTYTLPPSFGRTTAADWGTVASRQRPSRWTKDEDRFAYQRRSAAAGILPAIASPRVSRLMSPARRRGLSGRELLKAVA